MTNPYRNNTREKRADTNKQCYKKSTYLSAHGVTRMAKCYACKGIAGKCSDFISTAMYVRGAGL